MTMEIFRGLLKDVDAHWVTGADAVIEEAGPILPSVLRLGDCAGAALAAQGAAIAEIWRRRSGERQRIAVQAEAASLATFSANYITQSGYPVARTEPSYPLTQFYQANDGRWCFMHGALPLLRNGLLDLLGCTMEPASIAAAVSKWDSFELEEAIAERNLCGVVTRSREEWQSHPQGQALAASPLIEIIKIGDAPPEPFGPAERPLSGLRVLDLTHILAGPTCGKMLAKQGATVMNIRSPDNPTIPPFDFDTGHGKLSAFLDLTRPEDHARLSGLCESASVFVQSFRSGKLAGHGFSAEAVAARRPGIVYLSVNCYGWNGPWRDRAGWEQLAQAATGMAAAQGAGGQPAAQPCFPNDYLTGFLGVLGVLTALVRRSEEGGSWHVRVSLCRTAMWLLDQGLLNMAAPPPPVSPELLARHSMTTQSPMGKLTYLAPAVQYEKTPSFWERSTRPLGCDEPAWPAAR